MWINRLNVREPLTKTQIGSQFGVRADLNALWMADEVGAAVRGAHCFGEFFVAPPFRAVFSN